MKRNPSQDGQGQRETIWIRLVRPRSGVVRGAASLKERDPIVDGVFDGGMEGVPGKLEGKEKVSPF